MGYKGSVMETFLNDCWALYFHDPANDSWDERSYQLLHTLSAVEDWVHADNAFSELWLNGMFFVMREHIRPMWEDSHNSSGGCLSFKVNKPDAKEYWFQLCAKTIGEVLLRNEKLDPNSINGISISPKRTFCILRVWLSKQIEPENFHLETPHYTQVLYKPHISQKDYHQS